MFKDRWGWVAGKRAQRDELKALNVPSPEFDPWLYISPSAQLMWSLWSLKLTEFQEHCILRPEHHQIHMVGQAWSLSLLAVLGRFLPSPLYPKTDTKLSEVSPRQIMLDLTLRVGSENGTSIQNWNNHQRNKNKNI